MSVAPEADFATTHRSEPPVFDLLDTPIERGVTVVEASAGTGKTYCLTGVVLRLLLEERVESVDRLLLVTFTQAATEELIGRVRSALRAARAVLAGERATDDPFLSGLAERHGSHGAEILRRALLDLDELAVSTIHGFCRRALEEHAFDSGASFADRLIENDEELRLDAARDVWRRLFDDGADPLLCAVAVEQGWTPTTFLRDVTAWRRHPNTELLPVPPPLDAAIGLAHDRLDALRRIFDATSLLATLDAAPWRPGRGHDASGARHEAVAQLAAWLSPPDGTDGGRAGLDALRRLGHRALAGRLRDPDALVGEPTLRAVDALLNALDALEHAVRGAFLRGFGTAFESAKERQAVLAFDDLLGRLATALEHPEHGARLQHALRRRYQAALIDEFQDTDLVQYRVFRALFREGPLILVGDPKQAIYRFRGADVFAYLTARRDADRLYTLDRNWRSAPELVQAVNAVFTTAEHPFVLDEIPFLAVRAAMAEGNRGLDGDADGPLSWIWLGNGSSAARGEDAATRAAVDEIVRLLSADVRLLPADAANGSSTEAGHEAKRPLQPSDLAVLVRTNAQAGAMQAALRDRGVPAVLARAGDIFHTSEMAELARLLAAVLQPNHARLLRAACATTLWGDDAAALERLGRDEVAWQRRVEEVEADRERWRRDGFVAMMRGLIDRLGMRERLLRLDDGERRLTNLLHAVEVLHRAIHERRLSASALLSWLETERARDRHDRDASELRLESDARAVTLVTVHRAKGLEYEVVLCPYLWKGRGRELQPPIDVHLDLDRVALDYGSDRFERHRGLAEAEELAEDLRLVYVALTRARRRTIVLCGSYGRGAARSALAYLLHRRQTARALDDRSISGRVERAVAEARARQRAWRDDLARLVADHPGTMSLRNAQGDATPPVWQPPATRSVLLAPRAVDPSTLDLEPWRVASFTGWSRPVAAAGDEASPIDRADPSSPPAGTAADAAEGFFAFARGARAGSALHEAIEAIDFAHLQDATTEAAVRSALERHGLARVDDHSRAPSADWDPVEVATMALRRVLSTRIPGADFAFADVARTQRLVEWQFWTSLDEAAPGRLADAFRTAPGNRWSRHADELGRLTRRTIDGFLTGFVDLVVEHAGRWWIVDWKTNHLGDRAEDYTPIALEAAMRDHHYVLQAHLYASALDRFLARRRPGYTTEHNFGGLIYVFLRGAAGEPAGDAASALGKAENDPATSDTAEPGGITDRQLSLFGADPGAETSSPSEEISGAQAVPGWWVEQPAESLIRAIQAQLFADPTNGGLR